MSMVKCSLCGAYMEERELETVVYGSGKRTTAVCPECFAELVNAIEDVPDDEAREIRAEWDADERYDEMMLEERR